MQELGRSHFAAREGEDMKKKEIQEARRWLKEFLINGTQHKSRMDYYTYFSGLLDLIELERR